MKDLPIIRPKKDQITATEIPIGWCHHGYRLVAVIGEGIPFVSWHTGPRTSSGTAAGQLSDGRKIVPCLDDGQRAEKDLLTWLTK